MADFAINLVSKARETVTLSICYKAVVPFPERNEKSISGPQDGSLQNQGALCCRSHGRHGAPEGANITFVIARVSVCPPWSSRGGCWLFVQCSWGARKGAKGCNFGGKLTVTCALSRLSRKSLVGWASEAGMPIYPSAPAGHELASDTRLSSPCVSRGFLC